MKMKELPLSERPYEKMEMYGAETLSNAELLAIIIKTGTKEESSVTVAQKILNLNYLTTKENLSFLQDISIKEIMKIKGIGKVKALQIKAIAELTKRMARPINFEKIKIKNSQDIANLLIPEMMYEKRELVKLIILNTKNVILKIMNISLGGSNFASIEPKEVLIEAIKLDAPKIILAHNHPSGDTTPSKDDFRVTERIYESANIIGIQLLDHIVIGNRKI